VVCSCVAGSVTAGVVVSGLELQAGVSVVYVSAVGVVCSKGASVVSVILKGASVIIDEEVSGVVVVGSSDAVEGS